MTKRSLLNMKKFQTLNATVGFQHMINLKYCLDQGQKNEVSV